MKKNEKGITLVILVITIIVMIILLSVTITVSLEQSGILPKSVILTTTEQEIMEKHANNVNDIVKSHANDWGY